MYEFLGSKLQGSYTLLIPKDLGFCSVVGERVVVLQESFWFSRRGEDVFRLREVASLARGTVYHLRTKSPSADRQ